MSKFNPRWTAYCKAHGKTSRQMLEHDRERWPGGVMTGYILWMGKKIPKFRKEHPEHCLGESVINQDEFTKFIEEEGRKDAETKGHQDG